MLGPVEFVADGRRLTVGSAHQRLILAILLARRGAVVSAEALIDAVWGDSPPVSARKSLHSHVSRLRRTLAAATDGDADVLVTESDGYRVAPDVHGLDADRFETLVTQAHQVLTTDPAQAACHLEDALGLWRGPAFGELARHERLRVEAIRLDQLRAAAIADLVDARLSLGDHQSVIADLESAVAADPLAERPHAQLMHALYLDGQQAGALSVYRQLQHRLAEEVGVDPSPEVQRLHQRILQQDAGLAMETRTEPAATAQAATPTDREPSPPPSAQDLIGRDEDVAAVSSLLASARVVTLTGPGGVGKSRLADAVVTDSAARFDDGVAWCGLAALRDPASVPAALVDALGLQQDGAGPPEELLLRALGSRRLLLVLDNCEHVLGAVAPIVDRVLSDCPHVVTLITSREYLRLPHERVWEVPPLPVPRPGAGTVEVGENPAVALLRARARAVDPSFELTDANAPAIAQLCRQLDGIPLAIELAAARTRALTPEDLVARLDHRFELLTGGRRDAGRHRTLQAMVDWSYELLGQAEARLFDRLSVFAGAFSLTAAERVCAGEPLNAWEIAGVLAELVDRSLVAVDRHDGQVRYRLLDTLRAYGAQRLEATGAADRTRQAHATYHVGLAEDLARQLRGPDERIALARLDAAIDDLRVAHAWLTDHSETDGALRIPAALHDDLLFRPRDEVFTWAERALELPGAPERPAYPAAVATAARGAMNSGDLRRAKRLAETALAAAAHHDVAALLALYVLTTIALYEGDLDRVLVLAERRLALADSLGQDLHRALAGVSRALALAYRGDSDGAVRAATDARRDAETAGSLSARAWALYSNGEALLDTDPNAAASLLEQAIDAARLVGRRFIEGVALVSLASLCGRTGQSERALVLFREAVAHWRPLGAHTQQLTTLRNLVELLVHLRVDEPAALLHGAVTVGATPSFGAEEQRLAAAWGTLERRLGRDDAAEAAARGRQLAPTEVVDTALAELDALLEGAA